MRDLNAKDHISYSTSQSFLDNEIKAENSFQNGTKFPRGAMTSRVGASQGSPTMDEQLGLSLRQNFVSLAYNVTAVRQLDSDGFGPGYFLNGYTNQGWWYQVGVSYDWPNCCLQGFLFTYEAWDKSASIFPSGGGAGLATFNGTVNPDDVVLLALYFSNGNVNMYAYDWNTGASAVQSYTADGATEFLGSPSAIYSGNGYWTGLLTEQYHYSSFFGEEQQVAYSDSTFALSSAWMWISEFNVSNDQSVFAGNSGPVSYSNSGVLQDYSLDGAAVASNSTEFITGAPSTVQLTVSYSTQDGSTPPVSPKLTYSSGGVELVADLNSTPATFQVDIGSSWSISGNVSSSAGQAWQTAQSTSGEANSSETLNFLFYHEYQAKFDFHLSGGGDGYISPRVEYSHLGSSAFETANSSSAVWADSKSSYSFPEDLQGSNVTERWQSTSSTVSGKVGSASVYSVAYQNQFFISTSSLAGAEISPSSGWYNSSQPVSFSEGAYAGWQPEGWKGSGSGSYTGNASSIVIDATSPISEEAIYYAGVSINSSPGGSISYSYDAHSGLILQGTTKTLYLPLGTKIVLTPKPTSIFYLFQKWSNGSSGAQMSVTINGPQTIGATFGYNGVSIGASLGIVAAIILACVVFLIRRRNPGKPPPPPGWTGS